MQISVDPPFFQGKKVSLKEQRQSPIVETAYTLFFIRMFFSTVLWEVEWYKCMWAMELRYFLVPFTKRSQACEFKGLILATTVRFEVLHVSF